MPGAEMQIARSSDSQVSTQGFSIFGDLLIRSWEPQDSLSAGEVCGHFSQPVGQSPVASFLLLWLVAGVLSATGGVGATSP